MRHLASRPAVSFGILGLLGQSMNGRKRRTSYYVGAVGAGTFTVPAAGWYLVLAYGPGGRGGSSAGSAASAGGGGGAAGKRIWLRRGEVVSYTVANAGNATVASTADGRLSLSAASGQPGGGGFVPGGAGGVGAGGDINRRGGTGPGTTNPDGDPNTGDGQFVPGTEGEYGGSGGGAGFSDLLQITYVAGVDGGGATPGGGGAGAGSSAPGGAGGAGALAFVYLVQESLY